MLTLQPTPGKQCQVPDYDKLITLKLLYELFMSDLNPDKSNDPPQNYKHFFLTGDVLCSSVPNLVCSHNIL